MKRLFKLLVGTAGVLCLSLPGHSMEFFDTGDHVAEAVSCPTKQPARLVRMNAHGDLRPFFAKTEFVRAQQVIESPRIIFPEQKELLLKAIQQGCTKLNIYIPRKTDSYNGDQTIDFSLGDFHFLNVTSIVIEHSAGDSRGFWQSALQALISNFHLFPNLFEITLSDILVDYTIRSLEFGTKVTLNCQCHYGPSDTIYPQEFLSERAESLQQYFQHTYNMYPFYVAEIQDPWRSLQRSSNQDRESKTD
jgi:hypothetical protein